MPNAIGSNQSIHLQTARPDLTGESLSFLLLLFKIPCEDLPFANDTFDSITIAFGIRNVLTGSWDWPRCGGFCVPAAG